MYVVIHTLQVVFLRMNRWNRIQRRSAHPQSGINLTGNHYCWRAVSAEWRSMFLWTDAGSCAGLSALIEAGKEERTAPPEGVGLGMLSVWMMNDTPLSLGWVPWASVLTCTTHEARCGKRRSKGGRWSWTSPLTANWTPSSFPLGFGQCSHYIKSHSVSISILWGLLLVL